MRPHKLFSRLAAMGSNQDGSVAIVFSFAVIALLLTGGIAVDFGRSMSTQAKLQAAADSAILSASRQAAVNPDMSEAEVALYARNHFDTALNAPQGVTVTSFDLSEVDGGYELEVQAKIPATLTTVVGLSELDISAHTRAEAGASKPLEVALVLDNTGSMDGAKMAALENAAENMVETLLADADVNPNNQTRMALVPFSDYVNVGIANRNAPWINVPPDYTDSGTYNSTTYPNKTGCTTTTAPGTCWNDGVAYSCTTTSQTCESYGDPVTEVISYSNDYSWYGCVASRGSGLDVTDGSYGVDPVPGYLYKYQTCPNEILPLTNDVAALNDRISSMSASRQTYIPAGLAWGWRVLSSQEPFTEGATSADMAASQGAKVLVLMTDGDNTRSADYADVDHSNTDETAANTVMAQLCTNIKDDNITIYTVAFEVTDATILQLLQDCASDAANHFDASDPAQLTDAFQTIANKLAQLRLTQ
jgi:Flp pilus assembly protein TadG